MDLAPRQCCELTGGNARLYNAANAARCLALAARPPRATSRAMQTRWPATVGISSPMAGGVGSKGRVKKTPAGPGGGVMDDTF